MYAYICYTTVICHVQVFVFILCIISLNHVPCQHYIRNNLQLAISNVSMCVYVSECVWIVKVAYTGYWYYLCWISCFSLYNVYMQWAVFTWVSHYTNQKQNNNSSPLCEASDFDKVTSHRWGGIRHCTSFLATIYHMKDLICSLPWFSILDNNKTALYISN